MGREVRWRRRAWRSTWRCATNARVTAGIIGAGRVNPGRWGRIGVEGTRVRTIVGIRIGHMTEGWMHSPHTAHTAHPVGSLHQA